MKHSYYNCLKSRDLEFLFAFILHKILHLWIYFSNTPKFYGLSFHQLVEMELEEIMSVITAKGNLKLRVKFQPSRSQYFVAFFIVLNELPTE